MLEKLDIKNMNNNINILASKIVNNEAIMNTFFNLKERWLDEYEYEDINDYKKVLVDTIKKQGFDINEENAVPTKKPFGIKAKFCNEYTLHIFVNVRGVYWSLAAKIC